MSVVQPSRSRDLVELILGYGTIVGVIWTPEPLQRILSPIVLVLTLMVVLARHGKAARNSDWDGVALLHRCGFCRRPSLLRR